MTRTMYDGIAEDAHLIPADAELVAGYVDGLYTWSDTNWARFVNAVKVRIAVFATTNDGVVLDCEKGNCTPAESVDWTLMRRKAGVDPTIYCGRNTWWQQIRDAHRARGVAEPHYWVADYDVSQTDPQIPAGALALQYADKGDYDLSVVADYWPGVDPAPEVDMPLTDDEVTAIATRTSSLLRNTWLGDQNLDGTQAGAGHELSLGVMVAQTHARQVDLDTKLDAITAAVGKLATGGVDLAALEALIETHLAAGSVPGVIAAAVLQHLSAATAGAHA
ncbi:MAG: hypothetical protein ACRDSS_03820 [Actinocrinis sp.]